MDLATLIGLLIGVVLVAGAILLEGDAIIYISLNSVMIVLGGTLAATMISFTLNEVANVFKILGVAFAGKKTDMDEVTNILVGFAEKARREGLLALEEEVEPLDNDFLKKGVQLVVDGTDPQLVRNILETKITFVEERHRKGQEIFNNMGTFSPAFGMIGTLIGLIRMLSALEDPESIGSGLATALLTTLYGTLFANLIFLPIAGKLKVKSEEEIMIKEVMIEGILSIQAGENPRIVEEKLQAFLSTGPAPEISGEEEDEIEMVVDSNV